MYGWGEFVKVRALVKDEVVAFEERGFKLDVKEREPARPVPPMGSVNSTSHH